MFTTLQLGGDVKQPWLMSKYDVIHRKYITYHYMPPEKERATAIDNMHKKFGENRMCSSEDMIADRQTNTQTNTFITILRCPIGGGVIRQCCIAGFVPVGNPCTMDSSSLCV